MSKRMYTAITIVALLLSTAAPAMAADINLGAGAKFAWDNYKRAVMDYSVGPSGSTGNEYRAMDYPSPRFGGNLQLNINRKIVVALNVDFGTFKYTTTPAPAGANAGDIQQYTYKYFKLGLGLDGKLYLSKVEDMKAAPYVFLGAGKYFAKTETPYAEGDLASSLTMGKLASPFYLNFGFGAEFIVNEHFSVGADIFGFRMEFAKANTPGTDFDNDEGVGYYTGEHTILNFYMYSGLTINFTFIRDKSAEPAEPASTDAWGTQTDNSGWGTTSSTTNSWGTPAPAVDAQPADAPGADASQSAGWATPTTTEETAATPVAQPAEAPQAKAKKKKKKSASASASVGAPPPPAP